MKPLHLQDLLIKLGYVFYTESTLALESSFITNALNALITKHAAKNFEKRLKSSHRYKAEKTSNQKHMQYVARYSYLHI